MEMDTDSLYITFARDTIDECVKSEKKVEWVTEKWKWFSSENKKTKVLFENNHDTIIPFSQWDKGTPGKFKAEYIRTGMVV